MQLTFQLNSIAHAFAFIACIVIAFIGISILEWLFNKLKEIINDNRNQ